MMGWVFLGFFFGGVFVLVFVVFLSGGLGVGFFERAADVSKFPTDKQAPLARVV